MKLKKILLYGMLLALAIGVVIGLKRGIDRLIISRTRPKEINIAALNPQSTIFAFDLHDVVVDPSGWHILTYFFKSLPYAHVWELIKHPTALRAIMRIARKNGISEENYDALSTEFDVLKKIKPTILAMIDLQTLNAGTLSLVHDLHTKGYKTYIASNIWPSSLSRIRKKFPELNEHFDGFFAAPEGARKPNPAFYQAFKQFMHQQGNFQSIIVFIDDEGENVIAANRQGMYGIRFRRARSLAKKLKKMGIS